MKEIIYNLFKEQVLAISKVIHIYFNLISTERIFNLIYQVNSIDTALHLLMYHKNSDLTLDNIIYHYLYHKDNKE